MTKQLILILIILILLPYAQATYITLRTTLISNQDSIFISTTNNGDESAYNLQVTLATPTNTLNSDIQKELRVSGYLNETFKLQPASLLPGSYPLIITIDYTDANNYPFSAISTAIYNNKESTRPGLILSMPAIDISGSKKLKLEIKNLDDYDKEVTARIIVPKELSISSQQSIKIKGKDSSSLSFNVKDFAARPDSSYAIFAIAEYEKDSRHYTAVYSSNVKIVKSLNIPTYLLILPLAILLVIFIIYWLKKRKHESKHSDSNKE